jgi:hypothetical protein
MQQIDVEKFVGQWWSQKSLSYQADIQEWIDKSYHEPLTFWKDLFSYNQELLEQPNQSIPFEQYNFYHDCLERHLKGNKEALRVLKADQEIEVWTYHQIHELVNAQVPFWKEKFKVKIGQTVAIILPQGIHFLVGLMTALRLGLIVCVLPVYDRFFGHDQWAVALEELKPDIVLTTSIYKNQLDGKWGILDIDLSIKKQLNSPIESHIYLANDTVQKSFDPFSLKGTNISLIGANETYLYPLRDGLLSLNLKQETTWARPLSSMAKEEPCCTLMALLVGATIVHLSDDLIRSNPTRLKDEPIEVIGISSALQQLWLKNPGCPSGKLKLWYKDPLVGNIHEWTAFNELNRLQKVPSCHLLINKKKGGIILFSQPKPLEALSLIHPSLGSHWTLLQLNGSGDTALGGIGELRLDSSSEDQGYLILAQMGSEWMVSSATVPMKEGSLYPIKEVEQRIQFLDFVQTCMILPQRHPKDSINSLFVLLIFVPPKKQHLLQNSIDEWTHKLDQIIQQQIGEAFVPDKILFYSIYPKMHQGKVDRKWVQAQYERGLFFRKQRHPLYHSLNLFKQSIYEKMAYTQ